MPGRVITSLFGDIDFNSDNINIETIKKLYETDFPYLEITELGKKELYGIDPVTETTTVAEKPKAVRKQKAPRSIS